MPFYSEYVKHGNQILIDYHIRINSQIKNVTLQVRKIPIKLKFRRKRVLSFIPLSLTGSLTVEAALSLSLFIFAVVCFMIPMKLMDNQRRIQAALETVCEDVSQYAYIQYLITRGQEESLTELEEWGVKAYEMMASAAICGIARHKVMEATDDGLINSISFARSQIMEDGETIRLVMDYSMVFPFPIFGLRSLPMESVSSRRAWIGKEGGRLHNGEEGEDEHEIVYVGKTRTKYHRSRTCHYIFNDLKSVRFSEIGDYRNNNGGKYYPCQICAGQVGTNSTIYIMESGGSYHSDPYCTSIIAYVEAVLLSEVKYLGGCSYCSIKKGG